MAFVLCPPPRHDWLAAGLRYYNYNHFLRNKFGARVQKVSVDARFTCPNVDGTVATGGCTFCDNRSFSPSRRLPRQGILRPDRRGHPSACVASTVASSGFWPTSSRPPTPMPPSSACAASTKKRSAIPRWSALAIGTRPDCVPDDVLDLLGEIAGRTYLSVEYGMQTIHDRSLDWMNRGHHYDAFLDRMARSRGRGFEICATSCSACPARRTSA